MHAVDGMYDLGGTMYVQAQAGAGMEGECRGLLRKIEQASESRLTLNETNSGGEFPEMIPYPPPVNSIYLVRGTPSNPITFPRTPRLLKRGTQTQGLLSTPHRFEQVSHFQRSHTLFTAVRFVVPLSDYL